MANNTRNTDGNDKFIRAVEEAFSLLNRGRNRSINSDDFCAIAKSVGIQLDSNEALSLIRTAISEQTDDYRHETELTFDQYSAIMLRYVGPSELNDELRQTFHVLDRDDDGLITQKDFDKFRYENSFFDNLDDEQYELVAKELLIQANNNKGINFNQFVNLMMNP